MSSEFVHTLVLRNETLEFCRRSKWVVDTVRLETSKVSIIFFVLAVIRLQKFGRGHTDGKPSREGEFTTVYSALFRTLPAARMFCQKAMLSHCMKPKVCFRSLLCLLDFRT